MAAPLRPSAILVLILAVAAALAHTTAAGGIHEVSAMMAAPYVAGHFGGIVSPATCEEGDCFLDESDDVGFEPETDRRQLLAQRRRFLSYGMLKKNQVPCNRRGASYYNCNRHGPANPYRRGCSYITRCARNLH